MAGIPPFDSSEVAPDWIGDADHFTHYSNKIKGYISAWRKALTKADTNVREFCHEPSDEMKELAQQSFQNMEVTFAAMSNSYEMAVFVAGEEPALVEKATKMMAKFKAYELERDTLEAQLKEGFKRLRKAKETAESKARTDAATASMTAAAKVNLAAGATAAAAAPTPEVSAVYAARRSGQKPRCQPSANQKCIRNGRAPSKRGWRCPGSTGHPPRREQS